jgi:hypothetical protein
LVPKPHAQHVEQQDDDPQTGDDKPKRHHVLRERRGLPGVHGLGIVARRSELE